MAQEATIRYRVEIPAPETHRVHVTMRVPAVPESNELLLTMPAWSPGSYLIREYGRHVEELQAEDDRGNPLPTEKVKKATWHIAADHDTETVIRYQVYAHELTVRTSHVDLDHAFLHGPSIFLFVERHASLPLTLEVEPPQGWHVSCALPRDDNGVMHADDFDELVDSPIECGTHPVDAIPLGDGMPPAEVAWFGWDRCDAAPPREEVVADMARIFPEAARVFSDPEDPDSAPYPFERYLVICHLETGFGGLEHRDSAALIYPRNEMYPRRKYERFLALVSHELFHAWNIKRLHPRVLGPFDYSREAYTGALWLSEGVTAYYEALLLRRAGLTTPESYLKHVADRIKLLEGTPGRLQQSAEQASFDAWIKLYRHDENTPNSTVSYYLKGELVGMMVDLQIRHATGGEHSLDDVMRLLWAQYGNRERGFEDDVPIDAIGEVGGPEVAELAETWVRTTEEVDFESTLALVGLKLERTHATDGNNAEQNPRGWLGVRLGKRGPHPTVATVLRDSPAELGGLCPGDEIIALESQRVGRHYLTKRLAAFTPGTQVRLSVFRRGWLRDVSVTLGEQPPDEYAVSRIPDASDEARALYEGWMQTTWEEPGAEE